MSIQTINIGNVVNDGLGDDLRTAFQKVNANFTELSASLTITGANTGTTGVGVFKEKVGAELRFKKLVSGTKMLLDDAGETVIVNNTAPDAFIRFDTDSGSMLASTHQQITLAGAAAPGSTTSRKDIEVTSFGSTISFKTIIPVVDILTSYDFGTITGEYDNAMQLAYQASNIDFGTITLPGRLDLDCGGILYAADKQGYTVNFASSPATVIINSQISGDDNITTSEFASLIPISGTVNGTMPDGSTVVGETVIITVNGTQYSTTINSNRTFTVNVLGSELAADKDRTIDARIVVS